ncbi:uncharacterized protein LOC143806831 isoform X2 [Ranitomeya variabilis]|uniref:uncharacterized protein LOC143806831 isoform X2 n=1 Tax=Ranitomeya variabilis TaxID=490064 RepID=UPI0040570926
MEKRRINWVQGENEQFAGKLIPWIFWRLEERTLFHGWYEETPELIERRSNYDCDWIRYPVSYAVYGNSAKTMTIDLSQRLTREERIEIVLMSGESSTRVIAADFNERHPTQENCHHSHVI